MTRTYFILCDGFVLLISTEKIEFRVMFFMKQSDEILQHGGFIPHQHTVSPLKPVGLTISVNSKTGTLFLIFKYNPGVFNMSLF